ncbi:PREDICTED: type I inositol 3,4-bisphosphate 4-phosphatase-like [Amphimedon queenslandica]|uniref:PH domain-containing protein n=1 Tax=Amphimedon queenslandica TaxID=400682 RepID=A0A1X7VN99_AMPQE|nr:PREDICTED: type I inositol 3,4-bisphosphate 4-phosphatase-like [Amphimedon queenslandica]|eukprot:XP_019863241.1 PREDICTED: type I inositol 3,4-bisphosphate 4-phosphatase-like [Amphimedon queenslandica]
MKFNSKELASFAAYRIGRADKEGSLWMRESDGYIRKKENYCKRWCLLSGNLLFYAKEDSSNSPLVGVIVLERAHVESEAFSGNRNAFRLIFQNGSDDEYWFYTDSARDADEWIRILNSASYEFLRIQFSELRGQIMHLTGKDPFGQEGPVSNWAVSPTLLQQPSSGYDGEPIFELLLSCSSLVGGVRDVSPPSPLIVTSCMTPPQAYWMRYAQTELVDKSCDPQFTTPVAFFDGSIYTATQLKFDVFDVCNREEGMMRPLGQCQCTVQELIRQTDKLHRFEIKYDDIPSGYLLIKTKINCVAKKPSVDSRFSPETPPTSSSDTSESLQVSSSYSFRSPIDNMVVRSFKFPKLNDVSTGINVTESMGESLFTFTLPMQIIEMCLAEENVTIGQFGSLVGLSEHWEIIRQEVCLELRNLIEHYSSSREAMQVEAELGRLFKKSVIKDKNTLEFVPVNLHVQEMKVSVGKEEKDRTVYTCVTVGCPTAYSLKYRQGGLARMQSSVPLLASSTTFSPATENKSYRVKHLLKRFTQHQANIKLRSKKLTAAAERGDYKELKGAVQGVAECVAMLENHCTVTMVQEALKDWYKALDFTGIPSFISSLSSLDPKSVLSVVEQHMVCVEAQVDGVITSKLSPAECNSHLEGPVSDLLKAIDQCMEVFQSALFFVLLKEHYALQISKVPIGLKGFRHRRDIVFSHTVTTATTSFVMKVLRSIGSKHFLTQVQEIGFLIHWESLLSTQGDEMGMLEDFITAMHDLNSLKFRFVQANSASDLPRCSGTRYKVVVDVPVQSAIFRILPKELRDGHDISTVAVLFTQGVNEQQSLADTFGDTHLQDQINIKSLQRLVQYYEKFNQRFGSVGLQLSQRAKAVGNLLQQLRTQVHARKTKNTDILTLSAELCRLLDSGRITSCKSAKDRTAMSVTLEEAHILINEGMDPAHFQQTLDILRSQGTRIRNAEKNVGVPLYAFNALQVVTLPKNYRPPEGTYKKLQT